MRELPRTTVRATGRALATWEAICEIQELAVHEAFDELLNAYTARLDPDTAGKIMRRARAIRRDRFGDAP